MKLNGGWYFYQPFYTDIFYHCKSFWKKLIFLSTFLEIYSERPVVYYFNLMPLRWVATPPPSDRKHRREATKTLCQRNDWQLSKVGGFWAFTLSYFLRKYRRKKREYTIVWLFLLLFRLFIFYMFCLISIYCLLFSSYNVL